MADTETKKPQHAVSKKPKSAVPPAKGAKTATKTGKTSAKRKKSSRTKSAAAWRSRQLAPTPDRYKEIQSALADRGYLKQSPSGVWDGQSADALKHFQQDQSLEPTGKLNSLSLIALGLGAKHGSAPPIAPASISPQGPAPVLAPQNAAPPSPTRVAPAPSAEPVPAPPGADH
ncbi:MAG TPA: peptidoglycan-binding protein [Bryobacteraceae bacterium]|nr:peptidoglycan-binding protein [Bryobacteraceae bacterium]